MYPPLMLKRFRPSLSVDLMVLRLHLAGLSSIFGSINIFMTLIIGLRLGCDTLRVPLFV